MAQQSIPYAGYPAPGALDIKNHWAGDHFGPANYQAGGYNLNAAALTFGRLEWAQFSHLAQSGNYYARPFFPAISGNAELGAPGFSYITVKWYAANNSEVANNTNLSAEVAQLFAFGM